MVVSTLNIEVISNYTSFPRQPNRWRS